MAKDPYGKSRETPVNGTHPAGCGEEEAKVRPLLVLTGPTAVGKTALSLRLAEAVGGEIVSADSVQVYRRMDIGSAKATPRERARVPHHLVDVLEPTQDFNVVRFQQMAKEACEEIWGRGRIPVVTGGTGFYIQALLYDIDFTENDEDPAFRESLEREAEEQGEEALHERLAAVDPASAAAIHPHNRRRVIRALEFYEKTGRRISEHNEAERLRSSPYRFLYAVLTRDREELYRRIDARVDEMIENGLVGEVEDLLARGCTRGMTSMQALGYKETAAYLAGEISLPEATRIIKRDTRHFAKRQMTWFRREREVTFFSMDDRTEDEVLGEILEAARARGVL